MQRYRWENFFRCDLEKQNRRQKELNSQRGSHQFDERSKFQEEF